MTERRTHGEAGPGAPEQTRDDTDVGWGDDYRAGWADGADPDGERLREELPPHHVDRDR